MYQARLFYYDIAKRNRCTGNYIFKGVNKRKCSKKTYVDLFNSFKCGLHMKQYFKERVKSALTMLLYKI